MSIKTVMRDVYLAADEPLRMRLIPFEHLVPRAEPIETLGLLSPERFRILSGLIVQSFVLIKALNMCVFRKLGRRLEDPVFIQNGFDRNGFGHTSTSIDYRVLWGK